MEMFDDSLSVCPHCGFVVGTEAEEAIHIEPGTLLHDRYIVGKVLGYGGFGVTYIGWDGKLLQKVAIKEYLPSEFSTRMPGMTQVSVFGGDKSEQFYDGMHKFVEEAKHLAKFQSEEGIVKVFDSFEENDTAYIIMEYLEGETLTEYLKRENTIPPQKAVEMLMPIMESLSHVHEEGILHRDIAPDNIFITKSGDVKLIDFGASRYATTSHSRSLTVIIKQGYSPEEQYRSRGDQGPHTDVYALAATIYKMVTGKTPPDAMERRAKYEKDNKDMLVPPRKLNRMISRNMENAILNAMNVRVEDRTPDIVTFHNELKSEEPVKRIYGKIKKIDLYTWPAWVKVSLAGLFLLSVTAAVLLFTGVINFSVFSDEVVIPEGVTIVPDVEGIYREEAVGYIEDSEMLALISGTVESEYIPAGRIIVQNPVGGTFAEKYGTVELTICSGNGVQPPLNGISFVPFVEGDSEEDAREKLKTAGLGEVEIETDYNEIVKEGNVISQSIPGATEVKEGTPIKLILSKGPEPFSMPDVTGKTETEAVSILSKKGLVVKKEYEKNSEVESDHVIRQSVSIGSSVKRGDTVTIVISSGKKTSEVPNVVGLTKEDASSAIKDVKLKVFSLENYDSDIAAGRVISQSPEGGSILKKGDSVTIYVSKGKQPVTVSFSGNNGSVEYDSKTVYYTDTYGSLPSASRTGYTFAGWYTDASGGGNVVSSTKVTVSGSHTLYAHWTPNTYTVNFNGNGGNAGYSSKSVTYASTYGDLPNASREGHSFAGWYTDPSGGTKITSGSTVKITSTQTLYAHWELNNYQLEIGGYIDGSYMSDIKGYGTFDVSVNGQLVADNVTSFSRAIPYGSSYTINDIRVAYGFSYDGVQSGSLSGTMGLGNTTSLKISRVQVTYRVNRVSSNGTNLGSYTFSGKYGTSTTIYPDSITGYSSPGGQSVSFNTLDTQTYTFTYTPKGVSNATFSGTWWTYEGKAVLTYYVVIETRNRTANSVQYRVKWTNTIVPERYYGYTQVFDLKCANTDTGRVTICGPSVMRDGTQGKERSATGTSNWETVTGISPTDTSLSFSVKAWSDKDEVKFSGSFAIPTY